MDDKAIGIVRKYIIRNIRDDHEDEIISRFHVFIVWKCKVLQNWKYILASDLNVGKIFELSYNGDADLWYMDVYQKIENQVILDENR